MLRLLSLLTMVSLVTGMSGMYGSQESHAKSAVKKIKKPAATANLKVPKTDKKFSELDATRTDRLSGANDLHSVPAVSRALRSH